MIFRPARSYAAPYSVRNETDLDALTAELLRVIQQTMEPETLSIWLPESNQMERVESNWITLKGEVHSTLRNRENDLKGA